MTYRAAYAKETPERGEIVLTLPEHSKLSDYDLIAEALVHAREIGIRDLTWDDIEVGDWTEES